jgi:uroporphyrinogen-III decarboxylase
LAGAQDDYVRFVQPYSRALIERIRATGVPVIHFGTGTDISYIARRCKATWTRWPVRAVAGTEDEDRRAAEAHRHAARTHF